ncbi:m phase inducer phosphatasecdc25 [Echinococcus multilocularis]|uniref:protein-tyrosine-phosphatase n=1 Tax=Echinococcus multilocularis TaxID=6211 RepID=A0A068XY79_ECHMU|nr:m phase inducer phosphatasecdc25 [Echinococcus multilocularis]
MEREMTMSSSNQGIASQISRKNVCPDRKHKQISKFMVRLMIKMLVEYRYSSQYIDESANQEAPSLQAVLESLASTSSFVPANEESVKGLHDIASTLSSGYFSTSSQSFQQTSELADYFSQDDTCSYEGGLSRYLRRTQSNIHEESSENYTALQTWGKQSSTFRRIHSSTRSSNAYRALFAELPTIHERQSLIARNVRFAEHSLPHSPAHKRPRFTSPSSGVFDNLPSQAADANLDDTLSVSDVGSDESALSISSPLRPHKSGLDIDRKQSSPKESLRSKIPPTRRHPFSRCVSDPSNIVQDRLNTSTDALYDRRKPSVLPVVERTGAGATLISVDTVAHLLTGKYAKRNVNFLIVDCRFPYEYNAGHIKEAVNIYTVSDLVREVFHRIPARSLLENESFVCLSDQLDRMLAKDNPDVPLPVVSDYVRSGYSSDEGGDESEDSILDDDPFEEKKEDSFSGNVGADSPKSVNDESSFSSLDISGEADSEPSHVIIFHCEFSSQRAPDMFKFLRKLDRSLNSSRYPFLFFPEQYVMKGGYSEFYRRFPGLCEPSAYMKMFHRSHGSDLRYYRRLTKHVSTSCDACFRNPRLFSFSDLSYSENKENAAHLLRKVRTMYAHKTSSPLSSRATKRQKLAFGESAANIDSENAQSPERQRIDSESPTTSSHRPTDSPDDSSLRLVEAVVRVGQHVIDAFERSRKLGLRSNTSSILRSASRSSGFGKQSRQGSLLLTDGPPTPIRPRIMPLSFSSSESSEANSPEPSCKS